MWRHYRLYSSSGLFLLLLLLAVSSREVDGARKTRPDSSNSIADEDTPDAVLNDQLLPTLDNDDTRLSNGSTDNNPEDDWQGSGDDLESSILSLPDTSASDINSTTITPEWKKSWPYFNTGCLEWLPINHIYFQLANSFLFLSYLARPGIYGLLYLRLMLAIGSAFFAIWGWVILCAFDTFLWNAVFFLINLGHGIYILYTLLTPDKPFDKQVEEVSK